MRVLVADDHEIVAEGLRLLLAGAPGIEVVGVVGDGNAAVAAIGAARVDVVVMDLTMPGLNGIDATRAIVEEHPGVAVLCLSMHADRHMVAAALQAGAAGYLLKHCAHEELLDALRIVGSGRTYLSPAIAGDIVREYVHLVSAEPAPHLTARERQVLQLIAEGRGTKEIGAVLAISPKTVATHREHLSAKLDLHTTAGLTKYAIRQGFTTAERLPPT